jgi:hypothetical protein
MIDTIVLISGDNSYNVIYSAPTSLYHQNKDIRDHILSSVHVGDSYDRMTANMDSNSQAMQELQAQRQEMWAGNDEFIDDTRQKGLDNWLGTMQQGVEKDRQMNEEREEDQKEKEDCMASYGLEIC